MARRDNLLTLHSLATTYHCRPSAIVGIEDGWTAYQLDLACLVAYSAAAGPGVGPRVTKAAESPKEKKFADIRGVPMAIRKMEVPESGIW